MKRSKKNPTIKSMLIEHMLTNGNDFSYTDMIRFVFESNNPGSKYDYRLNRGYYSCAFSGEGYWTSNYNKWSYAKALSVNFKPQWKDRVGYMFKGNEFIYKKSNGRYSAHRLDPHFRLKQLSVV